MRIALHPKENRDITVEEYIKEFGHKPLNLNYDNQGRIFYTINGAFCPFIRWKSMPGKGNAQESLSPASTCHP